MRILAPILLLAAAARAQDLDTILDAAANAERWQGRWAAIVQLSHLPQDDRVFQLRLRLRTDPRPSVREAIAWACLHQPDLANATLLGMALRKDPDPAVRRAAARALVRFKDRRAVSALVEALAAETDRRTFVQIVDTLRSLTPAPCLLDPEDWAAWWSENEEDPRFQPADEEPKRETYEGVVLETRTVAAVPDDDEDEPADPIHVLVLPTFGMTSGEYGAYLLPLRTRAAITWVRLPSVQELTGKSGFGSDLPVYPVDRLVKAFDLFRTTLGIDRFVILAQGASGWMAMRYAVLHEDRVAALVLIDTALDKKAYGESLLRGSAHGTERERFTADTLMQRNNIPLNGVTLDRLQVYQLERGFRNPADMEIAHFYHRARDPQGFAVVPDIAWSKRTRVDVPSLFVYSAASVFSGHHDAERIQRHFPRSMVAPVREARGKPYVEENEKFHAILDAFLDRFDVR